MTALAAASAPFDITCKREDKGRPTVTVEIPTNGGSGQSYKMDVPLSDFGHQLSLMNVRTLNSGPNSYRQSYHTLYGYSGDRTPIRIYDVRENMYQNCFRVEEGGSQNYMTEDIRLLSLVGPYASYSLSQTGYGEGAAHPSAGTSFVAKNLNETRTSEKNQNTLVALLQRRRLTF